MIRVESLEERELSVFRPRRTRQDDLLVRFFGKSVQLRDSIVERLLGEVTSSVGAVEDFVVEHGEVQGETESDGVGRRKLGDGNVGGGLVGFQRLVGGLLSLVTGGELGEVSVVVSHPTSHAVSSALRTAPDRTHILW
jgi:hypothetical protein